MKLKKLIKKIEHHTYISIWHTGLNEPITITAGMILNDKYRKFLSWNVESLESAEYHRNLETYPAIKITISCI